MRNRMYGGVRGRKMKVGGKLLHFPPTRFRLNKFWLSIYVFLSINSYNIIGFTRIIEYVL